MQVPHRPERTRRDLTDAQILLQCKMYIAAVRIADDFGCDAIGIQYQQGLKDLLPASDLVEGRSTTPTARRCEPRRPARAVSTGEPLPHFNEVDECAGLDGLMTYRVHTALGQPVENTLHDLRWGDAIASARRRLRLGVPDQRRRAAGAFHRRLGRRARRPPAGDVLSASAAARSTASRKPGEIVWSRIYVEDGALQMDLGRGGVVELPREETERRWQATTPQWPIMHAVTYGVSRDQMMARHKANHIQVAYATRRRGRRRLPVHEGRLRPRAGHSRQRLRRPRLARGAGRPDDERHRRQFRPLRLARRRAAVPGRAAELPRSADAGHDEDRRWSATSPASPSDADWGFVLGSFKWVYAFLSPLAATSRIASAGGT